MKRLDKLGKHMIIRGITAILESDKMVRADRYTGPCTPGASDSTTFRSNHSYGYALRCKAALSNTPDPQSSGISMEYPG